MQYLYQLAPLRFFAAVLIVFLHFGQFVFPFNLYPLDRLIWGGFSALSFFFFLSGFVLSYNYIGDRPIKFKSFFIKRFARVYPIYILAALLTLISGMLILDVFPKGFSIILQTIGLQSWVPGMAGGLNFPSWTVSVEISMYLLFPLIVLLYKRIGLKAFSIFTVTFWVVSFLLHLIFINQFDILANEKLRQFTLYFPLWHLNGFIFGVLGGIFVKSEKQKAQSSFIKWRATYLISFAVLLGIIYQFQNNVDPLHNGILVPLYFLICAGFAMDNSMLTRFLSKPIFTEMGNTSYTLYIFQYPIFILFVGISGTENLSQSYFYIYLFTLLIFSFLIHKFFENPARNFIVEKLANRKVGDRLKKTDT
jgi:peptidoglycan/LPS O-acetylase OafA/YrhL